MATTVSTNLTDADFTYDIENDVLIIDLSVDMNITGEEFYKSIQKQILDEHSFYEIHAKCSFESDGECCPYREKAEKYDACGNLINQVNELLQENKALNEDLENTINQLTLRNNSVDNLKEDVERWKKNFEQCDLLLTKEQQKIEEVVKMLEDMEKKGSVKKYD